MFIVKMQCSSFNLVPFVLLGILFISTQVNAIPSNLIKHCQETSRDCLKESIQATIPGFTKGVPELGIDALDPFKLNNLTLTLPGNLILNFKEGVATGIRKCIIDKARMTNDMLDVQFHCSLKIKGKYSSSGQLLMFSIDGDGDSTIKCKNIKLAALLKLGSKMSNSQKYLKIKNQKVDHWFEGPVSYQVTNLIKGNPEMSKIALEFMNQNWRLVAEEFGKPIVDYGVAAILKNIKQLFKTVPMKEIVSTPLDL